MTTDTNTLIASLRSKTCPACGHEKPPRKSFCWKCFARLPKTAKGALYAGVGNGYERAVDRALELLGVSEPAWTAPTPDEQGGVNAPSETTGQAPRVLPEGGRSVTPAGRAAKQGSVCLRPSQGGAA